MTDFDADEPVQPLPQRTKRFWTTDRIIGWSGAALALMAAFFPWYVFVNEDKFSLDALRAMVSGDPAQPSRRATLDRTTAGIPDRKQDTVLPPEDRIITGTVPALEEPRDVSGDALPVQPLPAAPRKFRLLKVINGQAMIEDVTGIYVVRRGDVLPDRAKVTKLEQQGEKWVLETDGGAIYVAAEK